MHPIPLLNLSVRLTFGLNDEIVTGKKQLSMGIRK
jgi:hypothetical protein